MDFRPSYFVGMLTQTRKRIGLLCFTILGAAVAASALGPIDSAMLLRMGGERRTAVESSPSLSIVDSVFFLSPGDQLRLRWWGNGTGDEALSVNTRWEVVVPDIGKVKVRGVRFDKVRDSLEAMVSRRVKVRLIDLQITKVSTATVLVTGLVPNPGALEVPPGTRLSTLLAQAGLGMQESMRRMASSSPPRLGERYRLPSVRRVLLVRGAGADSVWCDLAMSYNSGSLEHDPPLFQGDRVEVFPQGPVVALFGSGSMTGFLEAKPGETVESFLRAAGTNPLPEKVRGIHEDGRELEFSMDMVLDTTLAAVQQTIPTHKPLPSFVWVAGLVNQPGGYLLRPGMTARDLVKLAGGIPGGEDSGVVLAMKRGWVWIRPGQRAGTEASTQYPEVRTALIGYMNHGRGLYSSPDIPLQAGDSVLVQIVEQVVWVGGQVNNPGFVPWKKGATVDDYARAAGGYAPRPWVSRSRIFNLYTDQVVPVGQPIPPSSAIVVPERRYLYPDQWLGIVATIMGLVVSTASFYIMVNQ